MLSNVACVSVLFILLTGLLYCPLGSAQTVVINPTDRGWYKPSGEHDPSNTNYLVGDYRLDCSLTTCSNDYRNFFVFDLAGISEPIASAKLALYLPSLNGYSSSDVSENYELHDVVTPIATLVDGTGGVAAHDDLGNGIVYGSRTITAADMGTVLEITLNSSAIAALDAATGLIGIGGSLTTLDDLANGEYAFAFTNPIRLVPELRLTFGSEPGDFNFDGLVDAGDYVAWWKNDGTQTGYDQWRSHFGQTAGGGSLFNSTVPEPSSLMLLGITAISLLGYRKAKLHR